MSLHGCVFIRESLLSLQSHLLLLHDCVFIIEAPQQSSSRGNIIAVFLSRALVKDMLQVVEVVDQDTLFCT